MFWKFTRFEWKMVYINRKSWLLAIFLLLFFLLYFIYYSQEEQMSLQDQKRNEYQTSYAVFYHLDSGRHAIPEVAEVYERHTEIQSLLGMQVWNIGGGSDPEQYVEDGLEINQLRLEVHDLGNSGISDHLIVPREDILKEDALLHYIRDNDLPIESDSFMTNHYITNGLAMMSGLLFLIILLISGNEILVYERKHHSVLKGVPITFIKKITSKVFVHSLFIFTFLILGIAIGYSYLSRNVEGGGFQFPVLMYQNDTYVAISTIQYLAYLFIGFGVVTILILLLSVLMNMMFRHAFANVLIGLGIFILPDIVRAAGFEARFLHPIKYIDINKVLSGELAAELNNPAIDFWNAMITLGIVSLVLIVIIYAWNKYTYLQVPKNNPLTKAF
ncbi:hypothetical protein ACFSBH_20155 [Oceanobacillus luteolus]|uniref:ABC transporter permease n=2 Tax=Oceanobacillus luteolus TaxID=1274358 RepID=A0ABW4HW84_9BACI